MLPPPAERVVRIAPTPSGFLHAGNALNFFVNALLATPRGRLLLRIDDLDRARFRPEYLEDIFLTLDTLGIRPTEGPRNADDFLANWSQQHRIAHYLRAGSRGKGKREVFACDCNRKELRQGDHPRGCLAGRIDPDAEGVALRVNTRLLDHYDFGFRHVYGRRRADFSLHRSIPDFALVNRDGRPSYQLACTVDDYDYGINLCARGRDLLPSTAAQAVISDLLGYAPLFERIVFFHHPLLKTPDGKKLSKSAGADAVRHTPEVAALRRTAEGLVAPLLRG